LYLENEFLKNPNWDHPKNQEIALRMGMTVGTVRKWNWDRRKKEDVKKDKSSGIKSKSNNKK
jgi:DNA-binding transcriptional regulator YiaG